jgi:hypothetical protein
MIEVNKSPGNILLIETVTSPLKMETVFNWFLRNNQLHQVICNPCTGGCCDSLEETHVNLNQGAESTVSYLMARLAMEKFKISTKPNKGDVRDHFRTHTKQRQRTYSTVNKTMQSN